MTNPNQITVTRVTCLIPVTLPWNGAVVTQIPIETDLKEPFDGCTIQLTPQGLLISRHGAVIIIPSAIVVLEGHTNLVARPTSIIK
jgi:hypothetical protein